MVSEGVGALVLIRISARFVLGAVVSGLQSSLSYLRGKNFLGAGTECE